MEILEAKESNKIEANRRFLKSLMVVNYTNQSSSRQQVCQTNCHPTTRVEAGQCLKPAAVAINQEIRNSIIKENHTRRRRRRRKQVDCLEDTNCDDNNKMEKIQFIKPKITSTWLAYLILLVPTLQVAFSPLPVAEAWNFFDGTQTTNNAGIFSNYSNSSSQLQSLAANSLLNVAAAAQSLVTGSDSSKQSSEPSDFNGPSPLGKILGEQASSSASSSSSSATSGNVAGSEPARSASSIAMHMLKPRKSSSSASSRDGSSKQQAAALEQQIINQHSRAHHHLSGGSHQRLLPTKHRDQKVVNSILDGQSSSSSSSSSSSDSRDSPLASLLGGFKSSAVTSRSSIVKAISDNKLARTALSTVSKTLGGNKYVAGAAAASALAALGLTVSKFLGPYFLAGGYNKLGAPDPMLGASSYLSQSFAPPQTYFNTDRNYAYSSPGSGDSMLASGSSSPLLVRAQQQQSSYPYSSAEFSYDPATGSFEQLGSSSSSSSANGLSSSSSASPSEPIYLTYSPRPKSSSSSSSPPSAATGNGEPSAKQSSSGSAVDSATGGHYTNFYSQQVDSAQPYENQAQGNYLNFQQPQGYYSSSSSSSGSSASPFPSSSNNQQQEMGEANSNFPNFYNFNSLSNNNNQQQPQQYEPLLPAASIESPSYASKPNNVQSAPKARRVGSVSLKMDDATRARLFQHLLKQQQQPMRILASPLQNTVGDKNGGSGQLDGGRPSQIAGVFVPISSATPSAEVYTSGSLQQQQQHQAKSGRMVPNGNGDSGLYIGHGGLSASLDNGQSQQQQQPRQVQGQPQVSSGSSAGYMFLKPNTDQQQQQGSSAWRSLANEATSGGGSKTAWQQPVNKQQASQSDENDTNSSNQQQNQPNADDDQQASDSAPRSRIAEPAGQPSSTALQVANGRAEELQMSLSHRVSRTPNQSSVTSELSDDEGNSRRPVESLTNYGVGSSSGKGLSGGSLQAGSVNLVPAADFSSSHHNHQGSSSSPSDLGAGGVKAFEQKLLYHHHHHQQQQQQENAAASSSSSTGGGDDSKTNLIQLNGNSNNDDAMTMDNKNNVIKLIDADTNGGSGNKLASNSESQYDAGLVIMSPPSSGGRSGGTNLDDSVSSSGGVNNQNGNSNQHRWSATAATGKLPQSSGNSDFPEMGTLTRSSFSGFTSGD